MSITVTVSVRVVRIARSRSRTHSSGLPVGLRVCLLSHAAAAAVGQLLCARADASSRSVAERAAALSALDVVDKEAERAHNDAREVEQVAEILVERRAPPAMQYTVSILQIYGSRQCDVL